MVARPPRRHNDQVLRSEDVSQKEYLTEPFAARESWSVDPLAFLAEQLLIRGFDSVASYNDKHILELRGHL